MAKLRTSYLCLPRPLEDRAHPVIVWRSVGDLRFNLPVAVDAYNGTYQVAAFGPACPQQAFDFPELSGVIEDAVDLVVNTVYNVITPSAEDCTCALATSIHVSDKAC